MKKSELKQQIKKSKGNDEFHMDVTAVGTIQGIACAIGKALCDLANTSDCHSFFNNAYLNKICQN